MARTAKQRAASIRNLIKARAARKKSPAKKLGMTTADLAKVPGTKSHVNAKIRAMGYTPKDHARRVKKMWKRLGIIK